MDKDFSTLANSAQSIAQAETIISVSRKQVLTALIEGLETTCRSLQIVKCVDEDNRALLTACNETLSYMRETLEAFIKTGV